MELRDVDGGAGDVCRAILGLLPSWFGIPEANQHYVETAETHPSVIASVDGEDIGLTTVKHHSPHAAEVYLMAVTPAHHRSGVGTAMLRHLEGRLAAGGVEFLQVKTLSGAHPDPGYAATRAFYLAYGFRPLEEFPTLWDPSNPALQLIKAVPQLRRPGPAQRSASGRSAPSRSASSAVVIRPFRPDDLESIVTLSLRAWEPVFASIYATLGARLFGYFFGDDWRTHQERDVRRACAAYHVSVADNRGRVDGFTAVDLPAEGVEGEIYMVAVDPSAQGAGLGTALTLAAVDQIERAGKQVAVVDTGADPGHAAARATYHKAGFTPWPSERFYRLLGDPATVYETDLS